MSLGGLGRAQSFGAAFESGGAGTQPLGERGSFSLDDIVDSALAGAPERKLPQQIVASCGQGFQGVVTVPGGAGRWKAPDPPAGTARGWIVRYEYIYTIGDTTYVEYEYESIVKLAPRLEDRGKYAAIMSVAADAAGAVIINERGQPNYVKYYRKRTRSYAEFGVPFFKGNLAPVYEYRNYFGKTPPPFSGDIYIGYGLISDKALRESARRANATQTMLPSTLAAFERELERARQFPQEARLALQRSCHMQAVNPTGRTAYMGEVGEINRANEQALTAMCASGASESEPMRRMCSLIASKSSTMASVADRKAAQIQGRRAQVASGGGTSASQRKLDDEMQRICATGDIEAYYARKMREAREAAEDTEAMARAGFWEMQAAYEDGAAKGTCWRVLQWQGGE